MEVGWVGAAVEGATECASSCSNTSPTPSGSQSSFSSTTTSSSSFSSPSSPSIPPNVEVVWVVVVEVWCEWVGVGGGVACLVEVLVRTVVDGVVGRVVGVCFVLVDCIVEEAVVADGMFLPLWTRTISSPLPPLASLCVARSMQTPPSSPPASPALGDGRDGAPPLVDEGCVVVGETLINITSLLLPLERLFVLLVMITLLPSPTVARSCTCRACRLDEVDATLFVGDAGVVDVAWRVVMVLWCK